ncbi:MAG: hypothetical protein ON057_000275 [Glomeribacter sp. 1016415]|nr:hypothetical protein [Glomeribacter sp. 1016415]
MGFDVFGNAQFQTSLLRNFRPIQTLGYFVGANVYRQLQYARHSNIMGAIELSLLAKRPAASAMLYCQELNYVPFQLMRL